MYGCMFLVYSFVVSFFFFKQKTAYEMRISDWSSDVCSSDLLVLVARWAGRGLFGGFAHLVDKGFAFVLDRDAAIADRSEERRVGKSVSVRVDLGGRRIIKKKRKMIYREKTEDGK